MWGFDGEKKEVFRDFGGLEGVLRLFAGSTNAGSRPVWGTKYFTCRGIAESDH